MGMLPVGVAMMTRQSPHYYMRHVAHPVSLHVALARSTPSFSKFLQDLELVGLQGEPAPTCNGRCLRCGWF
jgi:hypothetical protein